MRRSYVQIDGVLYERGTEPRVDGPMVIGDIQPYVSMADGTLITSRSKHREHLKAHGCIEVGDQAHEIAKNAYRNLSDVAPQRRHELIRAQVDAMPHKDFRAAIKRDIDRVKWNSRNN